MAPRFRDDREEPDFDMEPRQDDDRDVVDVIPERQAYDDHEERRGGGTKWLILGIIGVAVLGGAGAAGWSLLFGGDDNRLVAPSEIPVIRADGTPVKIRPENPGGMDVPNRDKLIYERLGSGETIAGAERLLPPPESPAAPPVLPEPRMPTPDTGFEGLPPGIEPPALAESAPQGVGVQPVPYQPVPELPVAEAAPQPALPPPPVAVIPAPEARRAAPPAPAPAAAPAPAPAPAPAQAAAPAPTAAAVKAAPNGAWLVQLGALREEQAAVKEWLRLQKAHPDLLSSLNQDIQRADLGDKGLFFRLRAGPLDEQAARNLCTQLSGRKVGCLVVKK